MVNPPKLDTAGIAGGFVAADHPIGRISIRGRFPQIGRPARSLGGRDVVVARARRV